MPKKLLPEDTKIIWNAHPTNEYRKFLYEAINRNFIDSMGHTNFGKWLFSQTGKTLKEAADDHLNGYVAKNMKDLLSERRCEIISKADKEFIEAFDEAINGLGYDCENTIDSGLTWSPMMIVYGKTGTKSRPCAARIYIRENGITLRLFLNNVDKHRDYIENAPSHIKDVFIFDDGDCRGCNSSCSPKIYTINEQTMKKCNHSTFYFQMPTVKKLPDYMELLSRFYPVKKINKK